MPTSKETSKTATFGVKNIGGINSTEISISPGVTVLTGKNATNRTSFLQAIMAVMGSDRASLKADADEGHVKLDLGDETYTRTLTQAGDTVRAEGDPYLDDPEVADLFAFLLETNEARQAVARGDDLREIIMRPVDTDSIKREIRRLEERKDDIDAELSTIESRQRDLTDLEQRRNSLREEIGEKREELAAKEEEIDQSSRDIEEGRKEQEQFEQKLKELQSTRSSLESIRNKIESQEASISSLKQERNQIQNEIDELPEVPAGDRDQIDAEIDQLRSERQALNSEISNLQSLIQYNEQRLEEEDYEIAQTLAEDTEGGPSDTVTDQLLDDDEGIVCWTCGSNVDRKQIEDTVSRLQDLRRDKAQKRSELKSKIDDIKSEKRAIEEKRNRRQQATRRLEKVEAELDERDSKITALKQERKELTETVETLETEVKELESEDFEGILSLHKEANQLEFEIDSLESDLESVTQEIEEIEELVAQEDTLRDQREQVEDELADKRTKIDQIEADSVEEFNEHMDAILEILEYGNLERIWIERVEKSVREGRKKVERTKFELHIVRTTENGAAYEDTIDHLSESEREVTGLIFALAGYLVHDLHRGVPFMLLDSLEAIDSDRIATLTDYFSDYVEYLVVALLPEDAQALDDSFDRVTSI
ncbi:archaea-specific SMC-related protein [Haloarcula laminariae]|uniref:archaea-specific SMC-related protein n=1 Tax=Haloarcula laminariae TaxID=2961577 RepID=UPI0021C5E561|nr:archaea-specific SMC-related protein [Halomicroarcula laminariae]